VCEEGGERGGGVPRSNGDTRSWGPQEDSLPPHLWRCSRGGGVRGVVIPGVGALGRLPCHLVRGAVPKVDLATDHIHHLAPLWGTLQDTQHPLLRRGPCEFQQHRVSATSNADFSTE